MRASLGVLMRKRRGLEMEEEGERIWRERTNGGSWLHLNSSNVR